VNSFTECVKAGYPVMESYPQQCRTPEKTFVEGGETCKFLNDSMRLFDAMQIAVASECGNRLKPYLENSQCNENTGTWWIDLNISKEGCNPACVINVTSKQAEINWRCTGLLQ